MSTRSIIDYPRKDGRTASVRMSEDITHTCEAAWGSAGLIANVTTTADATVYKIGAKSAKHIVATAFTTGNIAWSTTGAAAINFATEGYTHVKMWVQASAVIAAGSLTFGLDNAVDFSTAEGAGHRSVALPAIPAANTWYRVIIPLTANQMALTSVDSFGLTVAVDLSTTGNVTVYVDDVRFCKYEVEADDPITLPSVCSFDNANADGINTDVFELPFHAEHISSGELPQDVTIQYLTGNPGGWASTDAEGGKDYFLSGERVTDVISGCTALAVVLGTDLAAGEYLTLKVAKAVD